MVGSVVVDFNLGGSDLANNGTPWPVSLTLRRGGSAGTIIKTWSNIGGYFEAGSGGDPDFTYGSFSGTYVDDDSGTGSTEYYVSGPSTPYTESLDIRAEQEYYT